MQSIRKLAVATLLLALAAGAAQAQDKKAAEPKKDAPKEAKKEAAKNPVVEIKTNQGLVKVELYPEKAPITVKNFLEYVDAKHYDGTIFHRVISNFMIQGGGFSSDMKEKNTKGGIKNESFNGLRNETGTIAMARTNVPDSATAQFYINVKDNRFLDKDQSRDGVGYCVFGKVVEGMDVVKKIEATPTGVDPKTGMPDVPKAPVVIESVRRAK